MSSCCNGSQRGQNRLCQASSWHMYGIRTSCTSECTSVPRSAPVYGSRVGAPQQPAARTASQQLQAGQQSRQSAAGQPHRALQSVPTPGGHQLQLQPPQPPQWSQHQRASLSQQPPQQPQARLLSNYCVLLSSGHCAVYQTCAQMEPLSGSAQEHCSHMLWGTNIGCSTTFTCCR